MYQLEPFTMTKLIINLPRSYICDGVTPLNTPSICAACLFPCESTRAIVTPYKINVKTTLIV